MADYCVRHQRLLAASVACPDCVAEVDGLPLALVQAQGLKDVYYALCSIASALQEIADALAPRPQEPAP